LIFKKLRASFPNDQFIGEESTHAEESSGIIVPINSQARTWVVDPIDGTTNFVHGLPFVCVSIALFENDEPVVGVVFNPIMGEMYHAVKSHGAFFNDVRLPFHAVPFPETLAECLVSCEYGSDMSEGVVGIKFETVKNVVKAPVRGVRSLGSAALELCHVAKGVFDVFWEGGIHIWDVGTIFH